MREKVGKSRNTVFFQCGSGGSKSGLAKAAGAEPAGQMRDEKNSVHIKIAGIMDVHPLRNCIYMYWSAL